MLPVRGKSSENVSGRDFYWIALMHRRRAREARFAQGPLYPRIETHKSTSRIGGSVPLHKVAALQPAARGKRREAGSQLRG